MSVTVTAAVALVVVLAYSALVWQRAPDKLWEWWHGLVATVVSVALALATGFWVYNSQRSEASRDERASLTILLQQEFSNLRRLLLKGERATLEIGDKSYPVLLTYLQPLAIEKAAQSGLFDPVDTANLQHLAQKIRTYNVEVEFLTSVIGAGGAHEMTLPRVSFAVRNMEATQRGILEAIEFEAKRLKITLVDLP